jgi:hypothetical protein
MAASGFVQPHSGAAAPAVRNLGPASGEAAAAIGGCAAEMLAAVERL